MDTLFEGVYQKLISPDFGKNLGGELPLFIQPIPNAGQTELNAQTERLATRLSKKGKTALIRPLSALHDAAGGRRCVRNHPGRRT